jgi:eukaryotic-like serine/threonine-protein kinase
MKKIGRYEIVEELGRGAMGVVYKASDPTIGRLVAIKLLAIPPTADVNLPGAKDIFLREARAAGRLSHPGIVTVHDALEDPATHSSYIVMEFVPGQTLERSLLSGPAYPVEKALDVARQIAEALDYAHRQQIIHRDLKPANIMLTEDGRAKITDFGIAKLIAREDAQRTLAIMGTPAYMSPEQVTGGDLDGASDVFSLGILLYLMLTGQKPFAGDTAAVMFKIVYQDAAPPTHIRPELNQGHDFLVLRALAKDKKKRYASAREFLDDLDDVRNARPPRSSSRIPLSDLRAGDLTLVAPQPVAMAQKFAPPGGPKAKPRIPPLLGAGVAILGFLLAAGIWFYQSRPSPSAGPSLAPASSAPAPPQQAAKPGQAAERGGSAQARNGPPSKSAASTDLTPATPASKKVATSSPAKTNPLVAQSATENSTNESATPPITETPQAPAPADATPAAPAAPAVSTVHLNCQYAFEEAKLSISANGRTILRQDLKGRRQGKLLGLKRGYSGTFSGDLKVPVTARSLSVHIESEDGSVNLTQSISKAAPGANTPILHVTANRKQMQLSWE